MTALEDYLRERDWQIVHELTIPGRAGTFLPWDELQVTAATQRYLSGFEGGLYRHQKLAIQYALAGHDVCLSTATASGKSLAFFATAIDLLSRKRDAKILAIYPLKALGTEQQERWQQALQAADLPFTVGRVDGGVHPVDRPEIIANNQVLVMTPDIVHAWLLPGLGDERLRDFLTQLGLIIVDEAHVYSGVFGSNSAYLFRRLDFLCDCLGGRLSYIAASATINEPAAHLAQLTGRSFIIVDHQQESSPRHENRLLLLDPPGTDLLAALSALMQFIASETDEYFLAFVDSRKQTEYLATIATRSTKSEREEQGEVEFAELQRASIYPYRSGYEERDRLMIQQKLINRELKGIVTTSALEMGIDIPYLNLGILLGVPNSATSFYQRIGRIGRKAPGLTLLVNDGSVFTATVFNHPERLLRMPLAESTLYLQNARIQYIHALCLARHGGEADSLGAGPETIAESRSLALYFGKDFLELCTRERRGEVEPELKILRGHGGKDPNHQFPLREVEVQFKVELSRGPNRRRLGSLTHGQILREAYPGAVYYYQTRPYRVVNHNLKRRLVEVGYEKYYTTTPARLPTLLFPDFSSAGRLQACKYGDMQLHELKLQVRESVAGFTERRGPKIVRFDYPLTSDHTVTFDQPRFSHNFFTSGVLISHPLLANDNVRCVAVATLLLTAFMMTVPFDRQDLACSVDHFRRARLGMPQNAPFLMIYDSTYGSLRLSSRLMEPAILREVLERAIELVQQEARFNLGAITLAMLQDMRGALSQSPESFIPDEEPQVAESLVRVILPGSKGLNLKRFNEEFWVEGIDQAEAGAVYRGKHLSQLGEKYKTTEVTVPAAWVIEIPDESRMGLLDPASGKLYDARGEAVVGEG